MSMTFKEFLAEMMPNNNQQTDDAGPSVNMEINKDNVDQVRDPKKRQEAKRELQKMENPAYRKRKEMEQARKERDDVANLNRAQ